MRRTETIPLFLLALIGVVNASYELTVQLESLDLSGYLQNGTTRCSKLYPFGVKCYPLVAICIERITDETNDAKNCLTAPWIELGVWPNTESIAFNETGKLGGWYNPQDLSIEGPFDGFYVKLRVQHYYGTIVSLIDNQIWNITEFKGGDNLDDRELNGTQIISFKFSWTYSGAAKTTMAPKTTQSTASTKEPSPSPTQGPSVPTQVPPPTGSSSWTTQNNESPSSTTLSQGTSSPTSPTTTS